MIRSERWLDPPGQISLEKDELHIWRVWLDQQPPSHLAHLQALLSPDERQRADRFHFPHHRLRYIVARGTLRLLLGRYLNQSPESLSFTYGPQDKPALDRPSSDKPLEFNISHSEDLALMGFNWGRPIGIDVERIRPLKDMEQMARRFFSAEEYQAWLAVPDPWKDEAFFNCWTRKEAYIKLIGEGLSHPLDSFVVTLKPDEEGQLLSVQGSRELAGKWQMQALKPAPTFTAAVAVEGSWQRLRCWYYHS